MLAVGTRAVLGRMIEGHAHLHAMLMQCLDARMRGPISVMPTCTDGCPQFGHVVEESDMGRGALNETAELESLEGTFSQYLRKQCKVRTRTGRSGHKRNAACAVARACVDTYVHVGMAYPKAVATDGNERLCEGTYAP